MRRDWNLSLQRSLGKNYVVEGRYVGSKGTRLPRNIEANPAVWGPGATAQNADRRRIYANCPADGSACQLGYVALLSNITNSTYHAAQLSLSRRFSAGIGFSISYWFSKTLDYLSAMNLTSGAARPLCRRGGYCAESVQPVCRARALAVRCTPPLRAQWKLGDSGRQEFVRSSPIASRRMADERNRHRIQRHSFHRVR